MVKKINRHILMDMHIGKSIKFSKYKIMDIL